MTDCAGIGGNRTHVGASRYALESTCQVARETASQVTLGEDIDDFLGDVAELVEGCWTHDLGGLVRHDIDDSPASSG